MLGIGEVKSTSTRGTFVASIMLASEDAILAAAAAVILCYSEHKIQRRQR